MQDYSKILFKAYEQFLLPLGDKKVPTPYRINIPADPDPAKQGKSSPETLIKTTKKLAKEQGFNLDKAGVEQIQDFMRKNKLGIDCSGFTYRMLNHLIQKIKGKPLISFGFPNVGRTNVAILTSEQHTKLIKTADEVSPGDLIKMTTTNGFGHCLIVLENKNGVITYAHSTSKSNPTGVHQAKIKILDSKKDLQSQEWEEKFTDLILNPEKQDRVKRLKFI